MGKSLSAGRLRHVVNLQFPVVSSDSYGDVSTSYTDFGQFRAFVRPTSGAEKEIAARLNAQSTHVVTLRYNPNVTIDGTHRFVFKGRVLNVVNANSEDEANHLVTVYCVETTPSPNTAAPLEPEGTLNDVVFN